MKEVIEFLKNKYPEVDKYLKESASFTQTPDNISKDSLFIKFNTDTPRSVKEALQEEVNNVVANSFTSIFLIDDTIDTSEIVAFILELFFLLIGLIALILAFFLIWTSFYANIKENIVEYGIMR
jgi:ABC-type antimicrobial peptide transport system permease subunit